jgi:hypothetical protein
MLSLFITYGIAVIGCGWSLGYLLQKHEPDQHVAFWLQSLLVIFGFLAIASKIPLLFPWD